MENSPSVRVLPKVFADVPSVEELRSAKRSSGMLLFVTILLAGALIAAVAFLVITMSSSTDATDKIRSEANLKVKVAEERAAAAEKAAATNAQQLTGVGQKFDGLGTIADLDLEISQARADIEKELANPLRPGARASIKAPELWDAYDNRTKWTTFDNSDWRRYVQDNLSRRRDLLVTLKQRVVDWRPPAGAGGGGAKPPCDPREPTCR